MKVTPAVPAQLSSAPAPAPVSAPPAGFEPITFLNANVPVATSAEGCASGECIPEEKSATASATPEPTAPRANATPPPVTGFQPSSDAEEDDEPAPVVSAPVVAASGKDDPTKPLQERWRLAVSAVREASTRHGSSLGHGRVLWIRPGDVAVAFMKTAEFHKTMVSTSGRSTVEKALSDHFGRPTRLTIESTAAAEGAAPSLAEEESAYRQKREQGAGQKIRTHPAVLSALRILGGEIEHIQVLEPERKELPVATEPDLPDA